MQPLRIGVLLAPPPVQLLDLAPIDLFYMMSREYLNSLPPLLPQPIKDLGINDLEILYIADTRSTASIAPLTANLTIQTTHSLHDADVQPGTLSILLIPGPDPTQPTPDPYRTFIRAHAEKGQTDIITVCTGIFPACYAGICDGRSVTGPRGLLPDLRKKFPNVAVFEHKRWSVDRFVVPGTTVGENVRGGRPAELWTAAGITNGADCIAAYMRAHFDRELAEIVIRMADVGGRPQDYGNGQFVEQAWWMSTILKALLKRLW